MDTDVRLMTVKECCERGGISPATFYRLVKRDERFPRLVKLGGSTRVRSDEWDRYIDALADGDSAEAA